jgi:hypothetical protein
MITLMIDQKLGYFGYGYNLGFNSGYGGLANINRTGTSERDFGIVTATPLHNKRTKIAS